MKILIRCKPAVIDKFNSPANNIHRLIHATNPETIRKYLDKLKLDARQLKKLEKFRSLAKVESCLEYNAI